MNFIDLITIIDIMTKCTICLRDNITNNFQTKQGDTHILCNECLDIFKKYER